MKNYLLFLFLPLFIGCEEAISISEENVTSIEYSFHDSSVAPQYHRSYTIKITPEKANIVVDSYGDILAEQTTEIEANNFSQLIETINTAALISIDLRANDLCDGGTSKDLVIYENGKKVYAGYFNHCGGNKIPASSGDFESVIEAVKALVPNLSELLD